MFSIIIFFITASVGFLCTVFIFGKNKNQKHSLINKYLIVIIAINAIRFLFHGISQAYPEIEIEKLVYILDVSTGMLMPCYYFYFRNIVHETRFKLENLFHFIVPFLMVAVYITIIFASTYKVDLFRKLFFCIGISSCLIYAIIVFVMLYNNIWYRKSEIKVIQKQNDLIKNWSLFLYFSFIAMISIRIISSVVSNKPGNFTNNYVWMVALLWLGIFLKIILTPEILYGYNFLNKAIDAAAESLTLNSVWNLEGNMLPVTSERDRKLAAKIRPMLREYLHQIEEYSFHTTAFRNPDLSIEHIAVALKIPVSYIHFILKFHCSENFTDYKKIVRIHDAAKLIDKGYLKDHKVELLAFIVGFTSYNTFSIAFKNITGVTTQEYLKRF